MNQLLETVLRWWMHRNKQQKLFLWYVIGTFVLIVALPLFRIQDLDAVEAKLVRFFWSGMYWLQLVIILCFVKLVWLTTTTKWKKSMYTLLWRNNNDHLDNAAILWALLLILLTISELLWFYSAQISSIMQPTRTMLFIELLLLAWIIRQLLLTRLQRKKTNKKATSATTKVTHEIDESHKDRIFSTNTHHQDKSLDWLFGQE
jgi:hypothetical protein